MTVFQFNILDESLSSSYCFLRFIPAENQVVFIVSKIPLRYPLPKNIFMIGDETVVTVDKMRCSNSFSMEVKELEKWMERL